MIHTPVLILDPEQFDDADLEPAAEMIRKGRLVVFPTETVYGVGANALDANAVERIFQVKGRPAHNPIIVHIGDPNDVSRVVASWPPTAERLSSQFWPGPLTLVLPKSPAVPEIVTAGGPTVAIRVPAHPIARRLIQLAGVPVAAPSANRSGQLSPTSAAHVVANLDGLVDLIIDAGPTQIGVESTVLDLSASPPRLLRPGKISPAQLEAAIGPIVRPELWVPDSISPLPSPGLLKRHYAPRTKTECVDNGAVRVDELLRNGLRVGWVTIAPVQRPPSPALHVRQMPDNPREFAARLYATLHELDELGLDRIVVDRPPDNEDWLAVRDRLARASAQVD